MKANETSPIIATLRKEILSGKYLSSENPFPSERGLARRFGVKRSVVVQALQNLSAKGYLVRKRGKGTFLTKSAQRSGGPIGLIVPGVAYSDFFSALVSGVSRCAQKAERTLLFGDVSAKGATARVDQAKRFAETIVREGVSGVIYQPLEFVTDTEACNREILSVFADAQVPVVLIDCDFVKPPRRSDYDLVGIDNESAGGRLAEHLLAAGARTVHFLMHADRSANMYRRVNGVMNALRMRGAASEGGVIDAQPEDAAAIRRHLRRHRPDAIICGTDLTAALLKNTLDGLGLRVPDDVLLAGFDDTSTARVMTPQLTTIRQPCDLIAETAFDRLLRRLVNPALPPAEILLPAPLVARASTRRPEGAAARTQSQKKSKTKQQKKKGKK